MVQPPVLETDDPVLIAQFLFEMQRRLWETEDLPAQVTGQRSNHNQTARTR